MTKNLSIITEETIKKIASEHSSEIYQAVAEAYLQHFQAKTINPPSHFLRFPDKPSSRIIALPAALMENPRRAGIKWIASNPANIERGLKRASALIILNDYESGFPIACMEGAVISALRTVNSAILAAYLARKNKKIHKLGIIGCGNISKVFLECLNLQGWKVESLNIFDTNPLYAQKFAKESNLGQEVRLQSSLEGLIKNCDLTLFATTAPKPYIFDPTWLSHNPLLLNISLRDLAPEILINSNNIVDDVEHVLQANTSPHLTQLQYGHNNFINFTIGEMLAHNCSLDLQKPTIISPMGMGILDIAVADYLYNQAKEQNLTIEINNFFS